MKFIRIVEIIFQNKLCDQENFKQALIYQVIHTLKLGIEDADIVDMSIYSMQTLLNAIGLTDTIAYLDRFFAIAHTSASGLAHRDGLVSYCNESNLMEEKYEYWYEKDFRRGLKRAENTHVLRFDSHASIALQAPRPVMWMVGSRDCLGMTSGSINVDPALDAVKTQCPVACIVADAIQAWLAAIVSCYLAQEVAARQLVRCLRECAASS